MSIACAKWYIPATVGPVRPTAGFRDDSSTGFDQVVGELDATRRSDRNIAWDGHVGFNSRANLWRATGIDRLDRRGECDAT